MDTLQPACYGVASFFFALSSISICLRLYSRGFVLKSLGWDDWCMFTIFFFNCGQQAILYYFLHFGGGLHTEAVLTAHPEWMEKLVFALFAEEIYYVWMHFIIKMAFLLFYLRFATKTFRKLVYCTIGLNVVFTLIQWLLYCLQCFPLDAFFHKANHPGAKCLSNKILAFVPAALSICTDIVIVVLPIRPLWTLQATLRKRLELISIVCIGGIVVIISILRLLVLLEFQKFTDFTWSLGKIIIISCVELETAIIAANAPSLKIFFAHIFRSRTVSSSNDSQNGSFGLSQMKRGNGRTGYAFDVSGNFSRPKGAGRRDTVVVFNDDSSEEGLTREILKDRIVVTSEVGIETRDARSSRGDLVHDRFGEV
ncbi:hypothetical protein BP5796_07745 [Coleophoma crateriformis]|uniref:Rhodopsin domain-containing protein n=1 Tax=Coleophoma crateriformis TaxID=565419 RepID=A0A3D8RCU4_9HELO|nr:hypothetical protein BP5796_07745 [Coleophoma crateriformis]